MSRRSLSPGAFLEGDETFSHPMTQPVAHPSVIGLPVFAQIASDPQVVERMDIASDGLYE